MNFYYQQSRLTLPSLIKLFIEIISKSIKPGIFAIIIFPILAPPLQSQDFDKSDLIDINKPVGHYIDELRNISDKQLLAIIKQYKAKSINSKDSTTLSLEQCIQLAFANNPELKAYIELLQSRRDLVLAESRSWNPTASIDASSTAQNANSFESNQQRLLKSNVDNLSTLTITNSSRVTNTYPQRLSGNVNWNFLDFSRQPNINAAASAYSAELYGFYDFSRDLVYQIQTVYYQLLGQQELINSFEIIVEALRSTVVVTESRFDAGRTHLQDLGQAYAQYYNTLSDLTKYVERYYELSTELSRLVSLPEEELILVQGNNQLVGEWPIEAVESIDLARLNNDRVLRSLELSRQYNSLGIAAINTTLPVFYLSANFDLHSVSSDTYLTNHSSSSGPMQGADLSVRENTFSFANNSSYDLSAVLGFRWNFYQGGVNTARASSQFAESRSQKFNAENLRNSLTSSVRSSLNSLESNRIQHVSSEAAAEAAKISYIASIARLNAGLSDVTAVNQIVQLYQSALQAEIKAVENYNLQLSSLYRDTAIWPPEAEALAVTLLETTGLSR